MKGYNKLIFGTAGIPAGTPKPRKTADGITYVAQMGLGAMELEFVQSVNIKQENAPLIKEAAQKAGVELTCHGQYYINLSSVEPDKVEASIQRVLNAARVANLCGAKSLTFHAGYYQGRDAKEIYTIIKQHLKTITKTLKDESNPIWVRPETTGKATQFGDVDELVSMGQDVEQVLPCVDFAHLHARSAGKYNSYDEIHTVLSKIEKGLGRQALNNMHIHMAGIAYSEKGERNHLNLDESDFKYKDVLKAWKDFDIKGVVTCESPNIEEDALLLQKTYLQLKG